MVECTLRKLKMLSWRREALFANSDIYRPTNLSHTLDNTGNLEIGLSSSLIVGLSTLGMGDTLAIFQSSRNCASVIQPLMILVRGPAKWSATRFMNVVGIWSAPVEQSDLKVLIALNTSSLETGELLNRIWSSESSERFSISSVSST